MKYQARCNKRTCQARRTLNKRLDDYVKTPKCHIPGCSGLMYTDKHRVAGKPQHGKLVEVCKMDCRPWPHKTNDKECKQYFAYMKARAAAGHQKHSPMKSNEWTPF